jgi:ribosome biogenesis protein SSF1/2
MNNFSTSTQNQPSDAPQIPKHLETLVTTIFQSIFPPLDPQNSPLSSIKRVLLLNREPPSDPSNNAYTISLRHYAITSRSTGLTRPIKRINQAEKGDKHERKGKGVPNLSRLGDVSEFLLGGENGTNDGSYTSASESETDTDGEVEVLAPRTKKLLGRKEREKLRAGTEENGTSKSRSASRGVEKRAIKLTELGPRMRLRLVKVEEGLCGGKIMWHDHIAKSKAEERELEQKWEQKQKEKEERKRIQKENVAKKKAAKKGAKKDDGEESEDDDGMEYDIEDDEYWQDAEDGEESGEEVDGDGDEEMEEG